jgi:hypothetical protein
VGQGPCSAFHRYEIGELSFAEQRRARFADVAAVAGVSDGDECYTVWESAYEACVERDVLARSAVLVWMAWAATVILDRRSDLA